MLHKMQHILHSKFNCSTSP